MFVFVAVGRALAVSNVSHRFGRSELHEGPLARGSAGSHGLRPGVIRGPALRHKGALHHEPGPDSQTYGFLYRKPREDQGWEGGFFYPWWFARSFNEVGSHGHTGIMLASEYIQPLVSHVRIALKQAPIAKPKPDLLTLRCVKLEE